MKKLFLLLSLIIASSLICGCIKIDNWNNADNNIGFSWYTENVSNKDIFIKWNKSSWFNVSWYYNDILISWEKVIYNGLFNINIPKNILEREYSNKYFESSNTYTDKLILSDENAVNNLSVESYKTTSTISEICDYNSEYGWKLSSRKIINMWWIDVYFLNSSFFISSPDTKPSKSYESSICFINNNILYKILVSSNIKYKQDIIDSFNFIQ